MITAMLRRQARRVIVWALDGQPALVVELIEMKDRIADAHGSFDDRLDDLEEAEHVDSDDLERSNRRCAHRP